MKNTCFIIGLSYWLVSALCASPKFYFQFPGIDKMQDSIPITYLAVGDSYTIGESVAVQDRFPNQTVQLLRAKGIQVEEPEIIARTGYTCANIIKALEKSSKHNNYQLMTILAGVNDQFQGYDTADYRIQFTKLLKLALEKVNGHSNKIFVLSIPDYSVTPFGKGNKKTQQEIGYFNAINKQVSQHLGMHYVDISFISKQAANDPLLTAMDGLHPSHNQYQLWSQLLMEAIISKRIWM